MNYRKFGKTGVDVSALGFGMMRLPMVDGKVNDEEAIRIVRDAIDSGVNYLDTAYVYHDGYSEVVTGKILKNGYRDKARVATKSPVWSINSPEEFDKILDVQRQRLDTDFIDFYLLHSLNAQSWKENVLKHDLLSKISKAKADGRIGHIGFSFHDNLDLFKEIIDSFGDFEFCQIQLNYIDTEHQAGIEGLEYAYKKGLGVVVMEPLLGGRLANPPAEMKKLLPEERTAAEWGLDFIWNRPEVSIVLSGMSNEQQAKDNVVYAARASVGMVNDTQSKMYKDLRDKFFSMPLVGCTKCNYCMPCPSGVDIPGVYDAYNQTVYKGPDHAKGVYASLEGTADKCIGCKACEEVCPQHIETSALMPQIADTFK